MPLARSTSRRSVATALSISGLVFAGACGDDPTSSRPVPTEIRLLSPPTNSGTPGWPLPDSVVVEVLDAEGRALTGVTVTWTAANDADVVKRSSDTTNVAGRVSVEWTLGRKEGEQVLSIVAGNLAPLTVIANTTIFHAASITLGGGFACALTDEGRAYCWGWNYQGQLGNGTVGEPVPVPTPVAGELLFTGLTASGGHVCGLTAEGAAYCWGSNETGETGAGTMGNIISVPTAVQTTLRFTQISAGGVGSWSNSTCGLTAAGEAWCWGYNEYGKLGDGTTSNSAVPVRVLSDVPFTSIHTGFFHSCGIATTGELWCWGEQEVNPGPFGARPAGPYTTPVVVHEDFRFVRLVTGRNYTCAVTAQHAAFCWGTNWFGSMGNGLGGGESAVPVPVSGGHPFVTLTATGFEEVYGLTTDGILYRWGSPGNDVVQTTPIPVTQLRFVELDSGDEPFDQAHGACGTSAGNAVYCVNSDGLVRGVPAPVAP